MQFIEKSFLFLYDLVSLAAGSLRRTDKGGTLSTCEGEGKTRRCCSCLCMTAGHGVVGTFVLTRRAAHADQELRDARPDCAAIKRKVTTKPCQG